MRKNKEIASGEKYYKNKGKVYYSYVRYDVLKMIPEGVKIILDIGCGEGYTSAEAKRKLGASVAVGVEPYLPAAKIAQKNLDRVLTSDIEVLDLDYPEGYFDCIICADVLEHTRDPWTVLRKLYYYLSEDGYIVASIPNIQNYLVIKNLLTGKFDYEESGILDKTHLRFFTINTIKKMFEETGYEIIKTDYNLNSGWKLNLLNKIVFGKLTPFSVFQYLILARKKF
ncbi:MAG: class I SAM-dependent methyltransferase [Candidatus Kapabacteria bacterium]|nr:class I SAM-dependent methyltransferase [Candidatus Kapabacteria bacterium]